MNVRRISLGYLEQGGGTLVGIHFAIECPQGVTSVARRHVHFPHRRNALLEITGPLATAFLPLPVQGAAPNRSYAATRGTS